MRAVAALAVLELRRFLADRSNLFFVLVLPLILVVVLGLQATGSGATGRVAVTGDGTGRLVQELEAVGLSVTTHEGTAPVEDAVAAGSVDLGVVVVSNGPVELEVVSAEGQNAGGLEQLVRSAADRLAVQQAQAGVLEEAGLDPGRARAALEERPPGWSPAGVEVAGTDPVRAEMAAMGRFELGAGGQLLLFVFLNTLTAASAMIQARRNGAVRRTLAAPVTSGQTVVGLSAGRFAIGLFQGAYIMTASSLLFGVRWGNLAAALVVLAVFALVAAGVSLAVGVLTDSEGLASGVGVGAGLVLAALGGSMVPLEFFPDGLRTVALFTPHGWGYTALAEIQRRDAGLIDVLPQLAVLAAMALVVLALGAWLLRRSLARAM